MFLSREGRDLGLPLGLALGSPIFPSGCEGKLGVALECMKLSGYESSLPSLQAHRFGGQAQMPSTEAQGQGLLKVVVPESLLGLSNIKVPR